MARARREKAEIHWPDETGLSSQANHGRSFAPKGQAPVIAPPAKRFGQSMVSSAANQGKPRFMACDGAPRAAAFIVFPRRLVKDTDRRLFVIVDNLPVHRAGAVAARVAAHAGRVKLSQPPPGTPERNPDGFVNNAAKQAMGRQRAPMDKAAPKAGLTSHMRKLQHQPGKGPLPLPGS